MEQSLVQQQYEIHTDARVAVDALGNEYNHDARRQSPRFSLARLQQTVGGSGLGPRGKEEQRTQRASFVTVNTYPARVHAQQQQ